uniref:Uncharacterized protein n=1 Tax=Anguilla anguilla TaxID=7936 RepID=A0A0E9VL81_ANGAN
MSKIRGELPYFEQKQLNARKLNIRINKGMHLKTLKPTDGIRFLVL